MKAVILVNMGGPSDTGQIEGYLRAIFTDPAILPFPGFIRKPLAGLISRKRAPKVAERYQMIGGASPLPKWTEKLARAVENGINNQHNDLRVAYAFRYSSPTIAEAVVQMEKNRIEGIMLVPLFPHRTGAMTGSIQKEAKRVCAGRGIRLNSLPAWGNRPEILDIWRDYIRESTGEISGDCHLLFVAHGIPLRDVRKGDDYPEKVGETAARLGTGLPGNVRWSLGFQSKVGPVKWTAPYMEDEIKRISEESKNLLIMPLSFVSDCLETLYDLDIVALKMAMELGFENFKRIRVFNDDPRFAEALAGIIMEAV